MNKFLTIKQRKGAFVYFDLLLRVNPTWRGRPQGELEAACASQCVHRVKEEGKMNASS